MGFELDQFENSDHISPELICPICCGVLERPVQTSSEHLFCEDELLEWMERSEMCPVTNTKLDPSHIKKPSRIILNILGGLTMKCSNLAEGCPWTGKYDSLPSHLKLCSFRPRVELCQMLEKKSNELDEVKRKYAELKVRYRVLEDDNATLKAANETLLRQVKVYDAFVKHKQEEDEHIDHTRSAATSRKAAFDRGSSSKESDLQVINRLRLLEEKIEENSSKKRFS